jgi:hypothetical protein
MPGSATFRLATAATTIISARHITRSTAVRCLVSLEKLIFGCIWGSFNNSTLVDFKQL